MSQDENANGFSSYTEINDEEWKILYEEVKRRTDHQIETNQQIQNQASSVLRIVFTVLGVFATSLSVMFSLILSDKITISLSIFDIGVAMNKTASSMPVFQPLQTKFVFVLVLIGAIIYLGVSISNLTNSIQKALEVLSPTSFEPSISRQDMIQHLDAAKNPSKTQFCTIQRYTDHILLNQIELEATQRPWEKCYTLLSKSLTRFLISIIVFFCLFLSNPYYFAIGVVFSGYVVYHGLRDRIQFRQLKPYITLHRSMDLTTFCLFLVFFTKIQSRFTIPIIENDVFYSGMFTLLLGILCVSCFRLSKERSWHLFGRSVVTVLLIAGLLFFDLLGATTHQPPVSILGLILTSLGLAVIMSMIFLGLNLLFTVPSLVWPKVKNLI